MLFYILNSLIDDWIFIDVYQVTDGKTVSQKM